MRLTEVEFHLWPPSLLGSFPHFFYMDIQCRIGISYTWQLFFYEMTTLNYHVRHVDSLKVVNAHRAPKWSFLKARVSLRLLRFERVSLGGALREAMS